MTNTKHTPGPWELTFLSKAGKQNPTVYQIDGDLEKGGLSVCRVFIGGAEANGYSSEANAHLIAAAPELLEALKGAVRAIEYLSGTTKHSILYKAAQQAINKAEGSLC